MQVFWRTAVYGPALCDLSVARTVKDARAQHPAHLPVPLQRRSPGFHRDNPAVIYRHSCSAGGGPRGSASRRQKRLKGTAGAPSGPPLINRFLLLLKEDSKEGAGTQERSHTWHIYGQMFGSVWLRDEQNGAQRSVLIRGFSCSRCRRSSDPIRAKMTRLLSNIFLTEWARRNVGTGFTQQTT